MGAVTNIITRRLTAEKSNFDLGLAGTRGSGKSYTAVKLCQNVSAIMGTPFSVEQNVHFYAVDFLEKLQELTKDKTFDQVPAGYCMVLDEAGRSMSSQEWWEQEVKAVASELEVYRVYRFFTCFTSPSIQHVTKRARDMLTVFMIPDMPDVVSRRDLVSTASNIDRYHGWSYWRFQLLWNEQRPSSDKKEKLFSYRAKNDEGALDSVRVSMIDKKTAEEYEAKKLKFLSRDREERIANLKGEGKKKETQSKFEVKEAAKTSTIEQVMAACDANKEEWGECVDGKWKLHKDTARLGLRKLRIPVPDNDMRGYKRMIEQRWNKR